MKVEDIIDLPAASFLTEADVRNIAVKHGSPVYVYSEKVILQRAGMVASMPAAFGLRPRFAMKACPSGAVLQIISRAGVGVDASSGFEVERAMACGIKPADISLTAQELPANLKELFDLGIDCNACSLAQLKTAAEALRDMPAERRTIGVRFNPGLGSGHSNRTNVGGPSSGFGIWKDYLPQVSECAKQAGVRISRVHSHIGSGTDPAVWERCARMTLEIALQLPDVTTISLGGGFKVARMPGDPESDLQETGIRVSEEFARANRETGRRFELEIEPGAFMMARAGAIICQIIDVTDTGESGYRFIKVNSGMTEIIRPSMYGAQHPLIVVPRAKEQVPAKSGKFLVIGHCCESGDILTPEPGNAEGLSPRLLRDPRIGDFLVIGATGAYTSGFSAVNYNSFPQAAEVMIRSEGSISLIRRRQRPEQITENEILL